MAVGEFGAIKSTDVTAVLRIIPGSFKITASHVLITIVELPLQENVICTIFVGETRLLLF